MGYFNHACRQVQNGELPIAVRFNAFIRCCSAFGGLARTKPGEMRMQTVYDCLGAELGFDRQSKPTVNQMLEGTTRLIAARFRLLYEREEFARRRKHAKLSGERNDKSELYGALNPLDLLGADSHPRDKPE